MGDEDDVMGYHFQQAGIPPDETTDTTTKETTQDEQQSSTQPSDTGSESTDTQQQPAQETTQTIPADDKQPSQVRTGDKGNLVDEQGNIVASSGAARRHFVRLNDQVRSLTDEVSTLKTENDRLNALNNTPTKLGLTPDETMAGLQVVAGFKRDPLGTIKMLLTEANARGHNTAQLFGQTPQTDMAAIRQMLDERFHPFEQERQKAQQQQEATERARREYNAFMAQYPAAEMHQDTIANLMRSNPGMSPGEAYHVLENWVLRNRLDFTKPLAPQVETRSQGRQLAETAQPEKRVPPIGTRSTNPTVVSDTPAMSRADESWEDLIRQVMNTADTG